MGELYTCKDVAERYGVQIITVWEWIRKKKLGAIKIGKEYRVSAEDMKNGICGDGNFIDNVLGADYITHQIRENLYEIFIANKKIAYTDDGFALVAAGVFAALNRAVELHIIATDPEDDTGVYTVVIPKRADATDEQARNRQMPDIKWSAQLEGAVHSVKVNGTLRVTLNG